MNRTQHTRGESARSTTHRKFGKALFIATLTMAAVASNLAMASDNVDQSSSAQPQTTLKLTKYHAPIVGEPGHRPDWNEDYPSQLGPQPLPTDHDTQSTNAASASANSLETDSL